MPEGQLRRSGIDRGWEDAAPLGLRNGFWFGRFYKDFAPTELASSNDCRQSLRALGGIATKPSAGVGFAKLLALRTELEYAARHTSKVNQRGKRFRGFSRKLHDGLESNGVVPVWACSETADLKISDGPL